MPTISPVSPEQGAVSPKKKSKKPKKSKDKQAKPLDTPPTSEDEQVEPMNDEMKKFSIPFDNEDYKIITKLVFPTHTTSRQNEIENFCDQTGIVSWESLAGLGTLNHHELVNDSTLADCPELKKVLHQARLKRVLAFGAISKEGINENTTLNQIGDAIDQHNLKASTPQVITPEKDSDLSILKHRIPKLPKFNGQAANFYKFRKEVIHEFGRHGIGRALDTDDYHADQPAISEAAFNSLSQALAGGLSSHLADEHRNRGDLSVHNLFKALETTFDTAANRANFVVTAVKRLVEIRLDNTITAEAFISDFQQILSDLEENGTNLNDIRVILRAFLIHAIDAEEFKHEQLFIIDHPDLSISECFEKIRERENAHNLADGRQLRPDTGNPTMKNRRGKMSGGYNDKSKTGSGSDWKPKPWKIPPIPHNWGPGQSGFFSPSQFKLLNTWRTDCNSQLKFAKPTEIAEQFGVRKRPHYSGGGNDSGRPTKRYKTNRRAGKTKDDRVEEDDDNDEEEAESVPEFRFELNSPRIKNRRGKKAHLLGTSK